MRKKDERESKKINKSCRTKAVCFLSIAVDISPFFLCCNVSAFLCEYLSLKPIVTEEGKDKPFSVLENISLRLFVLFGSLTSDCLCVFSVFRSYECLLTRGCSHLQNATWLTIHLPSLSRSPSLPCFALRQKDQGQAMTFTSKVR